MERKPIGIQGISTGSNYEDGACVEMVNMRHEQGVLKPVESFPVDFTLKHVYELLYWHKNNDYVHLIGVRNNGIYWIQHPGEVAEDEGVALLTVTGTVTLSNMGNILNVLDGDVFKYLFWQEDAYYVIDMNFGSSAEQNPEPVLTGTYHNNNCTVQRTETIPVINSSVTKVSDIAASFSLDESNSGNNHLLVTVSLSAPAATDLTIPFILYYRDENNTLKYCVANAWILGGNTTQQNDFVFDDLGITSWGYSERIGGAQIECTAQISDNALVDKQFTFVLKKNGNVVSSCVLTLLSVQSQETGYLDWVDYDSWELVHDTILPKQTYVIELETQMQTAVSGTLHLVKNGIETTESFTIIKTVTIERESEAEDTNYVTFDSEVNSVSFKAGYEVAAVSDVTAKFRVSETNGTTHELTFTIAAGSKESAVQTILCSETYTSELISLSAPEEMVGPVKVDFRVSYKKTFNLLGYSAALRLYYSDEKYSDKNDSMLSLCKSLITKAISVDQKDGLLHGYFFACWAIELFDGSYIQQSNPVLLCQPNDIQCRYNNIAGNNTYDYIKKRAGFFNLDEIYTSIPPVDNTDDKYKESSLASTNAYNPSSTGITSRITSGFGSNYYCYMRNDDNNDYAVKCSSIGNQLEYKISDSIDQSLKSIIKSISLFISSPVLPIDIDKNPEYLDDYRIEESFPMVGTGFYNFYNWQPTIKSDSDILKELIANQKFYKVHEIKFDEINAIGWTTVDLEGKLGDNLYAQEELNISKFSNIKTNGQMTYNSMLHAWNVKNVASRGWPFGYFEQKESGDGQFPVEYTPFYDYQEAKWVRVKIKTDTGIIEVVNGFDNLGTGVVTAVSGYGYFTAMLSYPDLRATEMTIYHQFGNNVCEKTYKLTASSTGNFAYYISPDLKPINWSTMDSVHMEFPKEINRELSYQNKLKVSNTNNPFVFPDGQTYQIGDGTILNVASQSIRTSDGQFGQYPLVCFCTDGVFTLQVGDGTVAYSKVGTPQNYERPISKVICVTPYGIAFISNRGLCMVVGQDIEYLSEPMFEKFRSLTLELPEQIEAHFALDLGTFNDYLKACTAMVYNPKEQEIVMINPDKAYNYVYNMITKQFYRNTEAITNEINNSLPDMQVWNGTTVKKVTVVEAGTRAIRFVTRPIKMQTPDMKRFERVIVRAYLSAIDGSPATACIWGSVDDRNFKLLRGMVLQNGTARKDIDFGLFGKTTYRSYVIGLSMTVGTDSEIEAVEMQVEQEFVDTRMR